MTVEKHYLAADLGASGGRTIVGSLNHGKLTLREINRFWNGPVEIRDTLYWDRTPIICAYSLGKAQEVMKITGIKCSTIYSQS